MSDKLNWGMFSKYRTEIYGITAVMIMVFHSSWVVSIQGVVYMFVSVLCYGVDIFLFLSGICLFFSYQSNSNYYDFMKKRIRRTLIPYLSIGVFFWIWKSLIVNFDVWDFVYNATGLSLFLSRNDGVLSLAKPTFWYVGFILVMYAIFPIFYKAFYNVSKKNRIVNFTFLLLFVNVLVVLIKFYVEKTFVEVEIGLIRINIFLVGCYVGGYVKEMKPFDIKDYVFFLLVFPIKGITMGLKLNSLIVNRYIGLFAALTICFFAVFVFEKLGNRISIKPLLKVFSFLGEISLELYIIHVMLYRILLHYFPDISENTTKAILSYVLIFFFSILFSVIFNRSLCLLTNLIKKLKIRFQFPSLN